MALCGFISNSVYFYDLKIKKYESNIDRSQKRAVHTEGGKICLSENNGIIPKIMGTFPQQKSINTPQYIKRK
jgi:hypothetical protein